MNLKSPWALISLGVLCCLAFKTCIARKACLKLGHDYAQVTMALTPQQLEKGLMDVAELGEDRGMLFVFSPPRNVVMWMKNTPLSLDILFITAQGKVACLYEGAQPYSLKHLTCHEKVAWVIELKAGLCQTFQLKVGHVLSFPFIGDGPCSSVVARKTVTGF